MPSLAYITHIANLSEEFSQRLQSAGFHVRLFAPGEITVDECLLVLTPDAIPVEDKKSARPPASTAQQLWREPGTAGPLSHLAGMPGTQPVIPNASFAGRRRTVADGRITTTAPALPASIPGLGFIPSAMATRALDRRSRPVADAGSRERTVSRSAILGRSGQCTARGYLWVRAHLEGTVVRLLSLASQLLRNTRTALEPHLQGSWKPVLTVAILLFASLMLLNIRSATPPRSGNVSQEVPSPNPAQTESRVSTTGQESTSFPQAGRISAGPGRRPVDEDMVAEDFTRRVERHGSRTRMAAQDEEFANEPTIAVVRKRVVVN